MTNLQIKTKYNNRLILLDYRKSLKDLPNKDTNSIVPKANLAANFKTQQARS